MEAIYHRDPQGKFENQHLIKDGKKLCPDCKETKELENFYKDKHNPTGYKSYCKTCSNRKRKEYYQKNREEELRKDKIQRESNIDYYRKIDRERYHNIKNGKFFQLRNKAVNILNLSISNGFTIRSKFCQYCHSEKDIEGHHPDYSKPLEVLWLCSLCHGKLHTQIIRMN